MVLILVLMAKALDFAWKEFCETDMMQKSFPVVSLSLNIDGSEDHKMKFQGQSRGKPEAMWNSFLKLWKNVCLAVNEASALYLNGVISKNNIQTFPADLVNVFEIGVIAKRRYM